jgi:hypothetical protein
MARYTFAIFLYYPLFLFFLLGDHRETKREREIVPTPYLLILGGMCVFRYPGGMASTGGGLSSVWPCAF